MSWFGQWDGFDEEMQNAPDIFARKPLIETGGDWVNIYQSKYTGAQIEAMLDCIAKGKVQAAVCTRCGAPLNSDGKCEYCGVQYRYVLEEKK